MNKILISFVVVVVVVLLALTEIITDIDGL